MRRTYPILNILLFAVLFSMAVMTSCGTRKSAKSPAVQQTRPDTQAQAVADRQPSGEITPQPQEDKSADEAHRAEHTSVPEVIPVAEDIVAGEPAEADITPPADTMPADSAAAGPLQEVVGRDSVPAGGTAVPADSLAAGGEMGQDTTAAQSGQEDTGPKDVDFTADYMRPVKIDDTTALNLVGNVIFHHNGAVITCDSAIRYNDTRMECFNRVVVNKDKTYIYGDRADYNGELNLAAIYAPIIKVVDEDAVLYTYVFTFNTLDNIGRYDGGGTMSQKDNLMESKRGYYYADTREFIGVDSVELRNPEYKMVSDSVSYNIDTELARFYMPAVIWNNKDEILSADAGGYRQATADYEFRSNAYIMRENEEIWADTMDYNSRTEDAVFRSNIQMRDDEQKVMAFGDYGQYWGEVENGLLTREPSLLNFDPEQPDTLYMRADTMLLNTYDREYKFGPVRQEGAVPTGDEIIGDGMETEWIQPEATDTADSVQGAISAATEEGTTDRSDVSEHSDRGPEITGDDDSGDGEAPDGEGSPAEDEPAVSAAEQRKALKEEQRKAKVEAREAKAEEKRQERERKLAEKTAEREKKRHDRDHDHDGHTHDHGEADSLQIARADSLAADSLAALSLQDSVAAMGMDSLAVGGKESKDSLQRVFRGLRNVKIFREDLQAVCDSLVGFSIDSTMHLFKDPVLWTENNQIKSDQMVFFTRDEQLYKAEFSGSPFMSSEVDSTRYNQVKGRFMESWFRDNDIYRHDVTGNAQTYYYMQDEDTGDYIGFFVMESADITFLIEERQMDKITWRTNPDYTLYPIDKIPAEQEQFLPGFKWEAERRPKNKEEVFSRTIRPSQRELYEGKTQPQFPLTDSIMKDKERMIQSGIWRERNDVLTPRTIEYVRSLSVE